MKLLISILCSLIILNSCKESEVSDEQSEKFTDLSFKLLDFNPEKHKSFVNIKIENGLNPIEEQLKISDSGMVNYTFLNDRKRELIVSYESKKFSLIASPDETIKAKLVMAELLDFENPLKNSKIESGINKETNNLILANSNFIENLNKNAPDALSRVRGDFKGTDSEYYDKRITAMRNQLISFENYTQENQINNENFIDWGKAQIKYKAGNDLSVFPFYGPVNREINEESAYFNFVQDIGSDDNDEMTYHTYLDYQKTLATDFVIISNISNKYKKDRERYVPGPGYAFPITFNILKKQPNSNQRQLLFALTYKNSPNIPELYKDSLQYYTNQNYLAQVQTKRDTETATVMTLLENYDISDDEKEQLLNLFGELEGKVIFNDFWFSTCSPCMQEMPYYNDLISSLKKNSVEFVFFGVYMNDDNWQKTRKKFNLKGRHLLLTKDQLAFFERYFKVQGFPHHQIIDSDGRIKQKVRYSVYPENFEKIRSLIEEGNKNKEKNQSVEKAI